MRRISACISALDNHGPLEFRQRLRAVSVTPSRLTEVVGAQPECCRTFRQLLRVTSVRSISVMPMRRICPANLLRFFQALSSGVTQLCLLEDIIMSEPIDQSARIFDQTHKYRQRTRWPQSQNRRQVQQVEQRSASLDDVRWRIKQDERRSRRRRPS